MNTMHATLIRKAAALPPRQLHLIGAGLLLIVAAGLWFYALRAPLTALRAVRAEQAQLELAGTDPRPFAAQLAVLTRDTELLAKRLGGAPAGGATQLQVRLIGELGALAQAEGITLHGIVPAPDEMVLAFVQTGFDADVSGPYANLLAWMAAIEHSRSNLAIAGFEMHASATPGHVTMKIRIAAFRPQEGTP